MTDDAPRAGAAPTWFEAARQVLDPLLIAQSVLSLVEGAEASGLLAASHTWATPDQLAVATGLPRSRVVDIVRALVVSGVLDETSGAYRLTPAWGVLTGRSAFAPLDQTLRAAAVDAGTLRGIGSGGLGGGGDYWSLSRADRYAYARAVSPGPFAPGLVELFRAGTMTTRRSSPGSGPAPGTSSSAAASRAGSSVSSRPIRR